MKIKAFCFLTLSFLAICLFLPSFCSAQVTAAFTANSSSGCPPLNVTFTNTSTGAASYSWNFGNGNTSVSTSPGAIFSTPGTFTVTLTATSGGGATSTATATMTVFASPIASFTTSTMPSCPGQVVTFTDNSSVGSSALASWAWDFGDGNGQPSNTGTTTHSYATSNTFPVTMIVTDANGCSNSTIKPVVISPAPVASFTGAPLSACTPPLLVNFSNTSTTVGAITYSWTFGDGNTSTLQNPSNTYNANGAYNVGLTVVQGACSNSTTSNNYVAIQNIVADFSADITNVCVGYVVSFTDLSFPVSANQAWDFGDGTSSTATNPTHIYTTAGTYNVTLVEGTAGCQNTAVKNAYITVSPSPAAAFSANQTQSCSVPFPVIYSNTSAPGCIYTWDFGDGTATFTTGSTANFLYNYTTHGRDTVTLTVTSANGCITTLKKNAYILLPEPLADFTATPPQGCVPLVSTFTSSSTSDYDPIVSYMWNFGNGTATTATPTTTNTYNALGLFTVTLTVETAIGCTNTRSRTNYIQTGIKPTANFSIVDPTVCYGTDAEFNDLSVGADSAFWQFDVSQGTFSTPPGATLPFSPVTNLFPDTGTFFVTQIAYSNGCADTLKIDDIVTILPPKPLFTYQLSCAALYSVVLTNTSIGADSIVWDFGDGSPLVSDVPSPSHTYTGRGTKTATLTAYNFTTGCFSSVPQIFTITEPIAQFSAGPNIGCYPLTVTFTNTSQDDNGALWRYGDGTPDDLSNPSPVVHVYFAPELDTATLIITDINGCKDTTTRLITIYGPTPDFTANVTAGCSPLPVTLTDASISDSTLVSWTWDFGDGTPTQTAAVPSMNHTYATPGFYTVAMTVTDKNGCIQTATKPNYIKPTFPIPGFAVDSFACRGEVVLFNSIGSSGAAPLTYAWDFGDGTTGTGGATTHSYTADNLYTVTLTVTDLNGCDSSIQHQILIAHPVAAFTDSVLSIGCGVTNMQFTDQSTGVSINAWEWDFGDGASATQQNPMHAYTLPATYTVSLVTTNIAGCTDTVVNSVVVPGPTGTFSFTPTAGCPPLTPTFTAVSSTAISYTWDFGDGTVVTTPGPIVQHTYTQDIVATPILLLGFILSDGSSCFLTAPTAGTVTVVTVVPTVATNSNATSGCYPLTINFMDASTLPGTIPGDTISTWLWDFGDGSTSTLQNPSHVYPAAGTYQVSLSVMSFGGCSNNNALGPLPIVVHPYPVAAFSVNATSFDLPYDMLSATNQSVGAATYNWDFGDGTTSTLTDPQHLYTSVGIFNIQLIATTQFGCPDTTSTTIITNADVVFPNVFTPSPDGSNGGEYTLFNTNNDVFFPYTSGVVDYKFSVFDRWGEEIFESLDITKGWDGYYRGKICEQGVYVWKAYLKMNNGKEFHKNGDVTLLR
ncbi:MAG: PKD domain-containing protein [Bacteroidota bacterium]